MTDSNLYCQGNLIILKDSTTNDYKGGIYFKDSTGQEYCSFFLDYTDPSYETMTIECKDTSVNGFGTSIYNYYYDDFTWSNEFTGYGIWTIGVQAWGYNPEWSPYSAIHESDPNDNPDGWLPIYDSVCTDNFSSGKILTLKCAKNDDPCNFGFIGFDYQGNGVGYNTLVLGYNDTAGNKQVAQTIDMLGNVNFCGGLLGLDYENGRVGINKNPSSLFDVGGNANVDGNLSVGGDLDIGDVTATLSVDTVNQRVGISKLTPAYTLDVSGDVNTSTKYKIGGTDVLTSTTLGSSVTNSSLTSLGTLSSLSVTGDLTIDSTTLKVDSTNNRVGIVKASPAYTLDVTGDINFSGYLRISNNAVLSSAWANVTNYYAISSVQVLNSTTLGSSVVNSSLTSVGTLSSLSVTGDLTVDSTTLKVDSTNNRVGVCNASPDYALDVTGRINVSQSYRIGGTDVLGQTTLGSTVVNSSLTSVGTLSSLSVTGNLTIDSNTLTVDSTNNRVGIIKSSPAYPLDVVGDVNTSTKYKIGGTDVLSVSSGDVVLGGSNVYHPPIEDDLICTIVPRGGTATLSNINGTGVYAYDFDATATSEVSFIVQLSHKWQEGSDVTPHFHWCPDNTNTGNALFKLDYWVVNIGEAVPASVTTLTQTTAAPGVAWRHTLTSFGAVSMTGKTASCMFGGRLYRVGSDGSDTFTGKAFILGVDLHVKNNRLGYNT
jgi:hypothetical protein